MYGLIRKTFIVLLCLVNHQVTWFITVAVLNSIKCISLKNQLFITRPTLVDLNPDEYNQGFCWYPFLVSLDRCKGSCNTLDDLSSKIGISNITEDVNVHVFNMKTEKIEPKTIAKDISYV